MAAPIGKGDWVECINDRPPPGGEVFGFNIGDIACVLAVSISPKGNPCVALADDPNPAFWSIKRFRPIYRPKREIIEALKAPPIRVRETEDA